MNKQLYGIWFLRKLFFCFVLSLCFGSIALAQASQGGVTCKPLGQKASELGCWIVVSTPLGPLTTPVYWTLDTFPTRDAAERARGRSGTVVEALGKFWLFTIGPKLNESTGGTRASQIGPLPIKAGRDYTAQYMEATMEPGMVSRTHSHSGVEAFYTESGETCIETPQESRPAVRCS